MLAGRTDPLTEAEEAAIVAEVIPGGFGGLYYDWLSGTTVVTLTDLDRKEAVGTQLRSILFCGAAYPGWDGAYIKSAYLSFRQGAYSAVQLLDWFRALRSVRDGPAVWASAVDPRLNRVWLALEAGVSPTSLQEAVAAAGVPAEGVALESPPPAPLPLAAFTILESPVRVDTAGGRLEGAYRFDLKAAYTNVSQGTRYVSLCVEPSFGSEVAYWSYQLDRWDGTRWIRAFNPTCVAVIAFRSVMEGGTKLDTVHVIGARRLDAGPVWFIGRPSGTYRLVGEVYRSLLETLPVLTDPVPFEERLSAPFRLIY